MPKKYTRFQVGQEVTVIPELRKEYGTLLDDGDSNFGPFTIVEVKPAICRYCCGHGQLLKLSNGSYSSGSWFDKNTPHNRTIQPAWCNSGGFGVDGDYSATSPWHGQEARPEDYEDFQPTEDYKGLHVLYEKIKTEVCDKYDVKFAHGVMTVKAKE